MQRKPGLVPRLFHDWNMQIPKIFLTVVALLVAIFISIGSRDCSAQNQDKGLWRAASNTAASITGDIEISNAKLTINFRAYSLAPIRDLKPAEVAAVFDADVNTARQGALYRLNVPAQQRFLHRNTLCGTDDTQWMATYLSDPKTLQVAFFSGDDTPVLSFEAISGSSRVCGTYTFVH
jgi:hypothetical protein